MRAAVTEPKVCQGCGKTFERRKGYSLAYWDRQRFCSRKCSAPHVREKLIANTGETAEQRINANYEIAASGCWEWTGTLRGPGDYGVCSFGGKRWYAHRLSANTFIRPLKPGDWVLHHCDNKACVNPDHLYIGTPAENSKDTCRRGRLPFRGLKYSDVTQIRSSDLSPSELAEVFGVSETAIRKVVARKSWKHV